MSMRDDGIITVLFPVVTIAVHLKAMPMGSYSVNGVNEVPPRAANTVLPMFGHLILQLRVMSSIHPRSDPGDETRDGACSAHCSVC